MYFVLVHCSVPWSGVKDYFNIKMVNQFYGLLYVTFEKTALGVMLCPMFFYLLSNVVN